MPPKHFLQILLTCLVVFLSGVFIPLHAKDIGEEFYEKTKLTLPGVLKQVIRFKTAPSQYKKYPQAVKIKLPLPLHRGLSLEEAIKKRRSVRTYSEKALTLEEISQLLFAAQGITGEYYGQPLRSAPSAGALYPIEIYLVVGNVKNLKPGIYHYAVLEHSLELLKEGDFRKKLRSAALDQEMVEDAAVTFILTTIWERVTHKYEERGYRYAYIEAGHISQNIYLQATSLGLGSVSVGAFFDDKVNKLLEIDGEKESAIYLHPVGRR